MSEPTQLERLAKPFPPAYVKPPAQGKYGNYIDHEIVNQALLIILGPFSFKVEQVFYNPDGLLDGCTASLTATIDGREVTITEAGDCEHAQQKKTQGDRLKNAASDALKRCAMRLGCGIHVWAGGDDFFLYETLRGRRVDSSGSGSMSSDSAPTVTSPEPEPSVEANPATSAPGASPDPLPVDDSGAPGPSYWTPGKNQLDKAIARCSSLAAIGVNILDARTAAGLPTLAKMRDEGDWLGWGRLLADLENEADKEAERAGAAT